MLNSFSSALVCFSLLAPMTFVVTGCGPGGTAVDKSETAEDLPAAPEMTEEEEAAESQLGRTQ